MPTPPALAPYLRLQVAQDRAILLAMGQSAQRVEAALKRLEGKTGIGAAVRRDQLRVAQAEINREAARLWKGLGQEMLANQALAAAAGAETALEATQGLWSRLLPDAEARKVMVRSVRASAEQSLKVAAERISGTSYIPLADSVYTNLAVHRGKIDELINGALARGASARELAAEVRDYVNPNTPGGVRYAAMRLGRTELNNAFHASQVRQARTMPWVEKVKWHLSGSHPKPDECNDYADYGGEGLWAPNEVPAKPHPNCLCYTTPVTVSEEEFLKQYQAGAYDDYMNEVAPELYVPPVAPTIPTPTIPLPSVPTPKPVVDSLTPTQIPTPTNPITKGGSELAKTETTALKKMMEEETRTVYPFELDNQFYGWGSRSTQAQKDAFHAFQADQDAIQAALRAGDESSPLVPEIDELLAGAPKVQVPMDTYRLIDVADLKGLRIGDSFTDDAYMSTVPERDTVSHILNRAPDGDTRVVMRIRNDPGHELAWSDAITGRQDRELLMPRGTKLAYVGKAKNGDYLFKRVTSGMGERQAANLAERIATRVKTARDAAIKKLDAALPRGLKTLDYRFTYREVNNPIEAPYKNNCHFVTTAMELRARGWSVNAAQTYDRVGRFDYSIARDWVDPVTGNMREFAYLGEHLDMTTLAERLKDWPPESRGFMAGGWKGTDSGHIFNVFKDSAGKVHLIEGQVPEADVAYYLKTLENVKVLRVDDMVPVPERVLKSVTPVEDATKGAIQQLEITAARQEKALLDRIEQMSDDVEFMRPSKPYLADIYDREIKKLKARLKAKDFPTYKRVEANAETKKQLEELLDNFRPEDYL